MSDEKKSTPGQIKHNSHQDALEGRQVAPEQLDGLAVTDLGDLKPELRSALLKRRAGKNNPPDHVRDQNATTGKQRKP